MATTPNYGWVMPDPTDFVTDLPADFEIFGDAVDASFTAAEGDILVGGATNIFEPLTIGAADTVLTSDGTTAAWAAPGSSGKSYSLLNIGGTSLTGASTTISGLSGYDDYLVLINRAGASGANMFFQVQINSYTTPYNNAGGKYNSNAAYSVSNWEDAADTTAGSWTLAKQASSGSYISGFLRIEGGNTSGIKIAHYSGIAEGGTNSFHYWSAGTAADTNVISSLKFLCSGGTAFDEGTVYIYGAV